MIYMFIKKGKAKDVFKALKHALILEEKFGKELPTIEDVDFGKN